MDLHTIELLIAIVGSVLASSGFWVLIQRQLDKKGAHAKMLAGLAHDRIMYLGMMYIRKGAITPTEYENLCNQLYKPYVDLGGNGSATKLMEEVKKLRYSDTIT
jgi:hypothetical protein